MSIVEELRGKCAWCNPCSECSDLQERAALEIERLQQSILEAARKLSCVSIERDCKGVPEIVRICDNQALGILLEAAEAARKEQP